MILRHFSSGLALTTLERPLLPLPRLLLLLRGCRGRPWRRLIDRRVSSRVDVAEVVVDTGYVQQPGVVTSGDHPSCSFADVMPGKMVLDRRRRDGGGGDDAEVVVAVSGSVSLQRRSMRAWMGPSVTGTDDSLKASWGARR